MKKKLLLLLLVFLNLAGKAQEMTPDWYILERGCTVGVIRPGVNDLTLQLAVTNYKPLDKTSLEAMDKNINFSPGYVVLIYAKKNGMYLATDEDGRNLVIKGGVTRVERGEGSSVAYLKTNVALPSGTVLKKGSFVWVKEHKAGAANATVQCAGNQNLMVEYSKMYDINETTLDMAKNIRFKTAQ